MNYNIYLGMIAKFNPLNQRRGRSHSVFISLMVSLIALVIPAIQTANADPALTGQWSAPVELGTVAVNLNLLYTGKVLFWSGDNNATIPDFGELWNPATNEVTNKNTDPLVQNFFSNIFCSANVALPDGRLLVAGGHGQGSLGAPDASIFDPETSRWTSVASMSSARWYPSMIALGDGRAIIMSGSEAEELVWVKTPEIYNPATNQWTQLANASLAIPQYPMIYLLSDGRILEVGSTEYPTNTQTFNIATQSWTMVDTQVLDGGSSAMYLPGRIIKSGSASQDGQTPDATSASTTYVLNMNAASPAWRQTASMAYPRTFHNLTSLADGTVLATSGSQRKSETNFDLAVLPAELWSPDTETWTTLASMQTPRIYHSTAVLLPDGRVAVAGSGNIGGATDRTNVEVFSPPYLFKGTRPTISSAPSQIQYGQTFTVQTPNAADIKAVNLLRPGSATHNFDMNQRFVPLSFTRGNGALQIQATANSNIAPPGYYMLFLINNAGVPSVSSFVRFPVPVADSQPPTAPASLTVSGGVGGNLTLSWSTASDNVGVTGYLIYRSTASGFTPSVANQVGQTSSTGFSESGLAAGTYYYLVKAIDAAGNLGLSSNQAVITVAGRQNASVPLLPLWAMLALAIGLFRVIIRR